MAIGDSTKKRNPRWVAEITAYGNAYWINTKGNRVPMTNWEWCYTTCPVPNNYPVPAIPLEMVVWVDRDGKGVATTLLSPSRNGSMLTRDCPVCVPNPADWANVDTGFCF
jgi:hypothetical protein